LVYLVQDRAKANAKQIEVNPKDYLTWRQTIELSAQPDMIVSFAHYLSEELKKKGMIDPMIFADSMVSLNGRPAQRLINPNVDLLRLPKDFHEWILPAPTSAPK
jgi:vitamin K-dependent gamma-carboxylase